MSAALPRRPDRGRAPLSVAQEATWIAVLRGEAVVPLSLVLVQEGDVPLPALAAALSAVATRHAVLRTTVAVAAGRPQQVVAPSLPALPLRVEDVPAADAAEALRRARDEAQAPFDPTAAPGWRVLALRPAAGRTMLVCTFHPLVADAPSLAIFAEDLAAALAGAPLPVPERDYGDVAAWQRRWLVGEEADAEHARRVAAIAECRAPDFSRRRRAASGPAPAAPPAAAAAIDAPESVAAGDVGTAWQRIAPPDAAALAAIAAAANVETRHVLVALLGALLGRLSAQADVVIALAVDRRPELPDPRLLGDTSDAVAIPVDLAGAPSLRELVARVGGAAAAAGGRVPLWRILERLHDHGPVLAGRVVPMPRLAPLAAGAVALTPVALAVPCVDGLELRVDGDGADTRFAFVHDGSVLDRAQLDVLAGQFARLLEQAVAAPDAPLATWSLVTAATRAVLPDPRAPIAPPVQELVADMIGRVARDAPERIAIEHGAARMTYAALEAASRRLAQALVAAGVARGDVVVATGPRSPGLIVAMLGIFRSGGVLLAQDPGLPAARRAVMTREAGATMTVAVGAAPVDAMPPRRIDVDPATGAVAASAAPLPPLPAVDPEDPAYVFFTSGSTGVPKAVVGRHKSLSHFVDWQRTTFAIGAADRAAQMTGLSFIVVLRDVFTPLAGGATLCLPPEDWTAAGAAWLAGWLAAARITLLHAVPSMLQAWLPASPSPSALRIVFCTGEPLSGALVTRWRAAFGAACRVVGFYGATESSNSRVFHEVPAAPGAGIVPAGRPLPQGQALVLTPDGAEAGVGEQGEVVFRSPFLARGYLNAPGDTRFQDNPFRAGAGGDVEDRIYRTGDRGFLEADGNLVLLGRADNQLKIRGVRVEPDAIVALLLSHPQVAQCVVVAHRDADAPRLAAYVVARDAAPAATALRAWIAERMPEAMVPSSITFLSRLPLTGTGKLDRAALPAPHAGEVAHVAPRDAREAALAAIWAAVLDCADIGVLDDFFDRGGDSLSAARMLGRIRSEFGVELPIAAIFNAGTIADLAWEIGRRQAAP